MINEINRELEKSTTPIAKVFHKGDDFRIISLGLKEGVVLKDHKTPSLRENVLPKNVVLIVIKGKVKYKSAREKTTLNTYDKLVIPINELHSVEGIEDSISLLILS